MPLHILVNYLMQALSVEYRALAAYRHLQLVIELLSSEIDVTKLLKVSDYDLHIIYATSGFWMRAANIKRYEHQLQFLTEVSNFRSITYQSKVSTNYVYTMCQIRL